MAEPDGGREGGTGWVLALTGAALGAGAIARNPLGRAEDGLLWPALVAGGLLLLGLPLLLAEAALGQYRRRNVPDALGPGPWRGAAWAMAAVALLLAALVAHVAGLAARYAAASFLGGFYDDPARFGRLAAQGADAMLLALAAVAAAVALRATAPARLRQALAAAGGLALVAVAAVAAWGLLAGGAAGRDAALAFDAGGLDAGLASAALQQALLPGLVGAGAIATWAARGHDAALPRSAGLVVLAALLAPAALGAGLAAFAHEEGVALGEGVAGLFSGVAALSAAIGGTLGGVLAGTVYGVLLAGSLAALTLLLDVPAMALAQRLTAWHGVRAPLAAGLAVALLAVPLAFAAGLWLDLHVGLAAVAAPLGGLAIALHVGWVRPEVLDGFTFGEARHRVGPLMRPLLRFVLPFLLLALLAVGILHAVAEWGWADRGDGGLWRLVPRR